MPDINLLNSSTNPKSVENTVRDIPNVISKVLLFVLLLIVLFYGYLFYADFKAKKTLSNSKAVIDSITAEAKKTNGREMVVMRQGQVKELNGLVGNHVYWSALLSELAKVTLGTAKYTTIEARSDGKLSLSATLPSYSDLEKFLQIFDLETYNKQFSDVRIASISKSQQEDSLETIVRLELTFNPAFIKQKP
jgi:hypothetical protein